MKYVLLFLSFVFLFPLALSAEGGLNKPIVNINGQTIASEYLVGQKLGFTLTDAKKTVITSLKGTTYDWQIGESVVLSGPSITYTFPKPGTYQVTVSSTATQGSPQVIDSFKIYLLPTVDYKRPIPKVTVNSLPSADQISLDFATEVHFSAQSSEAGSAPIAKYNWDFGDNQTGEGIEVTHSYWTQHYNAKPILRLTDENGLQAEVSLELLNQSRQAPVVTTTPLNQKTLPTKTICAILGILAVSLLIVLLAIHLRSISAPKSAQD